MTHITPAVQTLLDQYKQYTEMSREIKLLERQLAKTRLSGADTADAQGSLDKKTAELQALSDAMTFDSPATWIGYKLEAYRGEAQPILTMHDLRVHCSKPGYICTKRFAFLNRELDRRGLKTLADAEAFSDTVPLEDVLRSEELAAVVDAAFMDQWNSYEYNTVDGRVAKWENWREVL